MKKEFSPAAKGIEIPSVPKNGKLILPLSMSRLHTSQNPHEILRFLIDFLPKLTSWSVDVFPLYTNGLYFNSDMGASPLRSKTNNQMRNHYAGLLSAIKDQPQLIPRAFHPLVWDHILMNTDHRYDQTKDKVYGLYKTDPLFRDLVKQDLGDRPVTDAHIAYILEEIIFNHALREAFTMLPHALSKEQGWRMICYPGDYLASDLYAHQHAHLPKNKSIPENGLLNRGHYNITANRFHAFDPMTPALR